MKYPRINGKQLSAEQKKKFDEYARLFEQEIFRAMKGATTFDGGLLEERMKTAVFNCALIATVGEDAQKDLS